MGHRIRSILGIRASTSPLLPTTASLAGGLRRLEGFVLMQLAPCTMHSLSHGICRYVRDIVLGVNDGIVSMFLLQTSAWNAGLTNRQTLLFGICGETRVAYRSWPEN